MEFLILVIVVLLFMFFVVVPLAALSMTHSAEKQRKKNEANAPQILSGIFNGDDVVTYQVTDSSLPYDTLMTSAGDHGYEYLTENTTNGATTVVFKKA